MQICDGRTDEGKWDTSIDIPITDCQRLGPYTKKKNRVVQIMFLYMKHKTCLLSRRSGLPKGIFVDDAHPELIQKRQLALRPILRLAKRQAEYKENVSLTMIT